VDLGLKGKACAVTGASRGIGRETARLLCAEGASVLLIARSAGTLAEAGDTSVTRRLPLNAASTTRRARS